MFKKYLLTESGLLLVKSHEKLLLGTKQYMGTMCMVCSDFVEDLGT